MKISTEENYIERINRVVAFLSAHIDSTASIQKLADIAAISPYHFHRVYKAITGESPLATIRRLRIAKACILLRDPDKAITDIAFEVGYDSSQAFAKAFRTITNSTASELRGNPEHLAKTIEKLSSHLTQKSTGNEILEVKVVSKESFRVVAHRHIGSDNELFGAFGYLFEWLKSNGVDDKLTGIYGIPLDAHDEPDDELCHFDCCFELSTAVEVNQNIRRIDIEGGLFAVTRHIGPYDGLNDKYT